MSRGQILLKRALNRTKLSPEQFAVTYAYWVCDYSGRSIRRWLGGGAIPPRVIQYLLEFSRPTLAKL